MTMVSNIPECLVCVSLTWCSPSENHILHGWWFQNYPELEGGRPKFISQIKHFNCRPKSFQLLFVFESFNEFKMFVLYPFLAWTHFSKKTTYLNITRRLFGALRPTFSYIYKNLCWMFLGPAIWINRFANFETFQ